MPVNRIKPHTAFKGPIESGCTKMAVVGFGKQPGAAEFHADTAVGMRDHLLAGIAALRDTGRLLGGVASVESAFDDVVAVRALTADDVGGAAERELTEQARALVGAAAVRRHRRADHRARRQGHLRHHARPQRHRAGSGSPTWPTPTRHGSRSIVLLGLTEVTAGNVLGIGFADFVPAALADVIDWEATYVNGFTAGGSGVRRARLPMVLPDEESCIRAALSTCGKGVRRAQAGRADRLDAAPHAVLGERRAARRAACGGPHRARRRVAAVTEAFFTIDAGADGTSGSSRPTTPADRGTPTPATAARRPACSSGPSSGRCPTCAWPASPSTSDAPCRWPGSRSRPRSSGPGGPPATAGPPSSTPTARCGPRRPACTSPSARPRCSRGRSTTAA